MKDSQDDKNNAGHVLLNVSLALSYGNTWYCAVKIKDGEKDSIIAKTTLVAAQKILGNGSADNIQAIIPMNGNIAGDPHRLNKSWKGGCMWWDGWDDIMLMQTFCQDAPIPGINK